jgi:hypothetical protein
MDDAGVLALVNQIRVQMAGFARTIVTDLADNKLSTMEGIQLGMQGMTLASSIAAILQGGRCGHAAKDSARPGTWRTQHASMIYRCTR